MMASSTESPPQPLRNKLSHVRYLLDDANKKLHEEVANCEQIFTTKTSAAASSPIPHDQNLELKRRTLNDISTLKSVLSCPIFNRIVNVTDSLDQLSYQLNLHPSIGPSDISIDASGELILAPPIEPTALNNLINSKLDEYLDESNISPLVLNHNLANVNQERAILLENSIASVNGNGCVNIPHHHDARDSELANRQRFNSTQPIVQPSYISTQLTTNSQASPNLKLQNYNNEKLVANGASKLYENGNKPRRHSEAKTVYDGNGGHSPGRPYQSNGRFSIDHTNDMSQNVGTCKTNNNRSNERSYDGDSSLEDSSRIGYSNEWYRATHELNQINEAAIPHNQQSQTNGQINESPQLRNGLVKNVASNGKIQSVKNSGGVANRGSWSPSLSAGSTVRLADEYDSGASSYQSQYNKYGQAGNNTANNSPYPQKHSDASDKLSAVTATNELAQDATDHELIDNPPTEMERIKVTLEKDGSGLGITIAGYTCDHEEISGIFIKSITPNSPADRSGKIRCLDQIFSVDGQEILGYSNQDAVKVLKKTGKVVTLELMRHLAESKFKKLQSALAQAVPTVSSRLPNQETPKSSESVSKVPSTTNVVVSPIKSSIPVSRTRDTNTSPVKGSPSTPAAQPPRTRAKASVNKPPIISKTEDSVSKTSGVLTESTSFKNAMTNFANLEAASLAKNQQVPLAAKRAGANKIIETKQGARNTIEIRSPASQNTSNAVYFNKPTDLKNCDHKNDGEYVRYSEKSREKSEEFDELMKSIEPEWDDKAQIIELQKDSPKGLGFTIKDYNNPKYPDRSIIMITSLSPGGMAETDGRLAPGDLLLFVDDTNLEGQTLDIAVRALKRTEGLVRLGVLKCRKNILK